MRLSKPFTAGLRKTGRPHCERPIPCLWLLAPWRFLRRPDGSKRPRRQWLTSRPVLRPSPPRFPLGVFLCPDPVSTRPPILEPALPRLRSVSPPSLLPYRSPSAPTLAPLGHPMSYQVRHAVSYGLPFLMCCSCAAHVHPHRPIPHTRFGIRKPRIRNPLAPSMERYRIFYPSHTFSRLTLEHGAVWCVPT
jgi:hypothetical protein